MTVHFICRGNAFRSIIAETYLASKQLPSVNVYSSGTVASVYKQLNKSTNSLVCKVLAANGMKNFIAKPYGKDLTQQRLLNADLTIFINQRVFDEANKLYDITGEHEIWSIADFGEPGRDQVAVHNLESQLQIAYQEIASTVDDLITRKQLSP